jgi:SNF2 family DNA or RNA helicase
VQAVVAVRRLVLDGEAQRILVVAPAAVLGHWRETLNRWAPELTAIRVTGPVAERAWQWRAPRTVHIAGYETVRNDIGTVRMKPWDVVILDEAQRIKNRDTAVSRACKSLPRNRAWALTGTPLENREDDLASILEFVRPNPKGERMPPLAPGMSLRVAHRQLQLRRRKRDVLIELPPKMVVRVPLELTREQRSAYERVLRAGRQEIIALGEEATVINVLAVITRLKQVCNFDLSTGRSAKLDDLGSRLAELVESGHRALVFSQWTSDRYGVARIASGIASFRPLTYTGTLGLQEREEVVARFRRNPAHAALVLSLRAGGQGLNLQEASYVFHFDRWWNPAVENQASDRVHRFGQKNAVTVYCYTAPDTIEDRIEAILDEKRALFADLVDGVSLDLSRLLTPEEIFGLIDLKAPASLQRRRLAAVPCQDPVASVREVLEQAGWEVRREAGGSGSGADLAATRVDELGLGSELRVFVRALPIGRGEVASLAIQLPHDVMGLLVCDGLDDETRGAAEAAGFRMWANHDLPG